MKESVSRLFLISCPSSFHLLAALKIIKPEATRLSRLDGGLAAVLVDNVTAHYYIDRAIKSGGTSGGGVPLMRRVVAGVAVDEHGFDDPSSPGSPGVSLTLGKVHSAMVVGLRNLQHALRVPIIATKHLFSAAGTQGKSTKHHSSLGFLGFLGYHRENKYEQLLLFYTFNAFSFFLSTGSL